MSANYSVCHIFDIPDEILVEILLHLNARERVTLADLCERFYGLVFKNKRLLRDLDFSKEGRLTSASDIQKYFNNKNIIKHILKVNLRNIKCIDPGQPLNDSIGKASNLVDIDMHGIEFKDLEQLACLLTPLVHIKRLSVNWPNQKPLDSEDSRSQGNVLSILDEPLSRLTYLSVRTYSWYCVMNFLHCVESCQSLKHLRIIQGDDDEHWNDTGGLVLELTNLEVLEIYANMVECLKWEFLNFISDSEKWTDFEVPNRFCDNCYYIEKNVEVCREILENEGIERNEVVDDQILGFTLRPERLLKAIIKITHERPPEFCLSEADGETRCALKIEDTKLLLKNPGHQIKYLYLSQSIGTECEVHSLALASQSLTELYLSDIMKIKRSAMKQTNSQKQSGLDDKNSVVSSFEMLVKNTPLLQKLTLNGRPGWRKLTQSLTSELVAMNKPFQLVSFIHFSRIEEITKNTENYYGLELGADENWDLEVLFLISGWQNLKSLCLLSIPIHDGGFLIDIGKQCNRLETLELYDLGPVHACCYTKDLSLMLTHCQNLTDFSMYASNIGPVSDVFLSLANNLQLRRVRLTSFGGMNDTMNLLSSVEQLLHRCSKLNTFVCTIDGISPALSDQLTSLLRRLRIELDRPRLQFQVVRASNVDTVCEDSSPPSFPYVFEQFNFTHSQFKWESPYVL